jgi:hypothetical protein
MTRSVPVTALLFPDPVNGPGTGPGRPGDVSEIFLNPQSLPRGEFQKHSRDPRDATRGRFQKIPGEYFGNPGVQIPVRMKPIALYVRKVLFPRTYIRGGLPS